MKKAKKAPKVQQIEKGQYETETSYDAFGERKEIAPGYEVQQVETASKTHLESDEGHGAPAIIRRFEFGINPQAFQEARPTKQDIFNSHIKGIETMLWRDGMKVMSEVQPRIIIDSEKMRYSIFVGAQSMRGHILNERPRTLTEIVYGK